MGILASQQRLRGQISWFNLWKSLAVKQVSVSKGIWFNLGIYKGWLNSRTCVKQEGVVQSLNYRSCSAESSLLRRKIGMSSLNEVFWKTIPKYIYSDQPNLRKYANFLKIPRKLLLPDHKNLSYCCGQREYSRMSAYNKSFYLLTSIHILRQSSNFLQCVVKRSFLNPNTYVVYW